jgi:hypothetical protein
MSMTRYGASHHGNSHNNVQSHRSCFFHSTKKLSRSELVCSQLLAVNLSMEQSRSEAMPLLYGANLSIIGNWEFGSYLKTCDCWECPL